VLDFEYKKHIQFLKGFSVVCVFLFHTNISLFNKGYLGVDVFFVILGFVITKNIFQNYEIKKKINLISFYLDRIKRIIPNLFFIVGVTYFAYLIFGPPNMGLFNQVISVLLGISNIYYLINRADYFDQVLDDPLAHTWVIGIVEQFYLLYPFLIFSIFLLKNNKLLYLQIVLLIVLIVSLIFFKIHIENNSLIAFYLSPLRFWELIFGGILFINNHRFKKNSFISLSALLFIVYLIFSPNSYDYFYLNLIIVLLSGLFIVFFSKSRLIENSTFVYFGNISYSFYLWHLPILFFFELYILNTFNLHVILSFIATVILSITSYHFIEQKFRYLEFKKCGKILYLPISFILLVSISLVCVKYFNNDIKQNLRNFVNNSNYLNSKYNWNKRFAFQDKISISGKKVYVHCKKDSTNFRKNSDNLKVECLKQKNYKTLFFIEGGSHTAQYLPMFEKLKSIENIYYTHSADYEISVENVNELNGKFNEIIYVTDIEHIGKFNKFFLNHEKFHKNIKFILFKSNPYPKNIFQPSKCLIQQKNCKIDKKKDYKKRSLDKLFEKMENLSSKNNQIFIFDTYKILCPNLECTIYDKRKDLLVLRDKSHLSVEGSESLAVKFNEFVQTLKKQNLIYN